MPTHTESHQPWDLADARGRPITRDRVTFAFWALAVMTVVAWCTAIWVTRNTLTGSSAAAQMLWLVPLWLNCAGAIYLLWRLGRFARQLPET